MTVFYSLSDKDQTLENIETFDYDIAGIMMRMRGNFQFRESYFYSISKTAFFTRAFRSFWQDYKITL